MIITSRANERIKSARALQQHKEREARGFHLIEGDKLVMEAIRSGAEIETVFAREGAAFPVGYEVLTVSDSVMEAISTQKSPQALCAVVRTPDTSSPENYPPGLVIVLDRLQDPGNLGTIIRTADALGATGLLLSPDSADPFSPKGLRSAMGSTYHIPIWIGELAREIPRMKEQGFVCVCGHLKGSDSLPSHGGKTALVIGNEGQGVSNEVTELCIPYRLPMRGQAESLNAAVFAALMMQRLLDEH